MTKQSRSRENVGKCRTSPFSLFLSRRKSRMKLHGFTSVVSFISSAKSAEAPAVGGRCPKDSVSKYQGSGLDAGGGDTAS